MIQTGMSCFAKFAMISEKTLLHVFSKDDGTMSSGNDFSGIVDSSDRRLFRHLKSIFSM